MENGCMLCLDCHQKKTERKMLFRREWLDEDQIRWLAEQGWVAWDEEGIPYGRGSRGFARATPATSD